MRVPRAALLLRVAAGAVLAHHGAWMLWADARWSGILEALLLPAGALVPLALLEVAAGLAVLAGRGLRPAALAVAPWLLWWGAAARPLEAPVGHYLPLALLAALASVLVLDASSRAPRNALDARLAAFAPWALWPVRFTVGVQLAVGFGLAKFQTLDRWVRVFGDLGLPWPEVTAPLVAFAELAGGAALVVGVLVRFTSVVMTVVLATAIAVAWLPDPPGAGWDYDLLLLGVFGALALAGPGRPTPRSVFSDGGERAATAEG